MNRHFTKEDTDGRKAHEKMFNSTGHWENANENHSGPSERQGRDKDGSHPVLVGMGDARPLWKTVCCFLKLNMHLPYDPAAALLGIYLRE